MSDYQQEKSELNDLIIEQKKHLSVFDDNREAIKGFISALGNYHSAIDQLTENVLDDLIDKVVIHQAEKINGKRQQQIDIYFKGIGPLNVSY